MQNTIKKINTIIIVCELDLLIDEGKLFAQKLKKANV